VRGSGQGNKLIIPDAARQVAIQAIFKDANHKAYRVIISTVEGRTIWTKSNLTARVRNGSFAVAIEVQANTFRDEDYILTLSGVTPEGISEDVAEYAFSAQHMRVAK
jgi:hypothetical protein